MLSGPFFKEYQKIIDRGGEHKEQISNATNKINHKLINIKIM